MKLYLILLCLLFPLIANAGGSVMICGGGTPAAAGCTTVQDDSTGNADDGNIVISNGSGNRYIGTQFQVSQLGGDNGYTICGFEACIYKVDGGSLSFNLTYELWSSDASTPQLPSSKLAESSAFAASSLSTSEECKFVAFTSSVALTDDTNYFLVLHSSAAGNATNYVVWNRANMASGIENIAQADGTPTWSNQTTSRGTRWKTRK